MSPAAPAPRTIASYFTKGRPPDCRLRRHRLCEAHLRQQLVEHADHLADLPRHPVGLEVDPSGLAHERVALDAMRDENAGPHLALDRVIGDEGRSDPAR